MDDEIAPILLVLSAPNKLWIEIGVARIVDLLRGVLLLFQHGLVLCRGNVLTLVGVVLERLDGFGCRSLGHDYYSLCQSSAFILEIRVATGSIAPCSDAHRRWE